MKQFKIRASACGQIMGVKGLGETGKTYCKNWLKEQLYNRTRQFSTKYTEKGNIVEDNSLDFIADQLGYGLLIKNEQFFENEFCTGTPDIVLDLSIIDAKNAWDCFTFPLFETDVPNKDYYWQGQTYLDLAGRDRFILCYVLSDTPINLIEREAYWFAKNNGYEDVDQEMMDEFIAKMTYGDVKNHLKIKTFTVNRDDDAIKLIHSRVIECREYIETLLQNVNL